MAKKLVVLSDMWGVKKGLWITSYLGYLQQYYDIVFYDAQQLANIDLPVMSENNLHRAFVEGGIDTAVAHLMKKESTANHYLAFSTGGTIAWKAAIKGLPMKSLYAVSATRVRYEKERPEGKVSLLYGENDRFRPEEAWSASLDVPTEVIPGFGHECYTDEKIIGKVCRDLLMAATTAKKKTKKVV